MSCNPWSTTGDHSNEQHHSFLRWVQLFGEYWTMCETPFHSYIGSNFCQLWIFGEKAGHSSHGSSFSSCCFSVRLDSTSASLKYSWLWSVAACVKREKRQTKNFWLMLVVSRYHINKWRNWLFNWNSQDSLQFDCWFTEFDSFLYHSRGRRGGTFNEIGQYSTWFASLLWTEWRQTIGITQVNLRISSSHAQLLFFDSPSIFQSYN